MSVVERKKEKATHLGNGVWELSRYEGGVRGLVFDFKEVDISRYYVAHTVWYGATTNCGLCILKYSYSFFAALEALKKTPAEICSIVRTIMSYYSKIQVDIKKEYYIKYKLEEVLGKPVGYMEYPSQYRGGVLVMAVFNTVNFPIHPVNEVAILNPKSKIGEAVAF